MLRWRLFGIRFEIQLSFFLVNALFAYILYRPLMGPAAGNQLLSRELLILMGIWVSCMLVTVMVHELGHVITGRIFGVPGNIVLSGLGGQTVGGYEELAVWKRLLFIFNGPCAGFLFVFLLTAVDGRPWAECMDWLKENLKMPIFENFKCNWFLVDWVNKDVHMLRIFDPRSQYVIYNLTILLLFSFNLIINIMNLLPIIPMDGGMIFKELCCLVSKRGGLRFAFGFSFLTAGGVAVYTLLVCLEQYKFISNLHLYYPFAFPEICFIQFAMLAYMSFTTYQKLAHQERYFDYMQDDDMSGPRRPSGDVVEVEPKDPRDFAPRAPGSERPRL